MAIDATVGGAASDSYVTTAEFDTYAAEMGWSVTVTEASLRRARMYLDRAYTWLGQRASSTQALQWPRYIGGYVEGYPVASDAIPKAIMDAQCEMAYLILSGTDPFATITGGAVTSERKKVDVIETAVTYDAPRDRAAYAAVDALVAPYATGKVGQANLSMPLTRG